MVCCIVIIIKPGRQVMPVYTLHNAKTGEMAHFVTDSNEMVRNLRIITPDWIDVRSDCRRDPIAVIAGWISDDQPPLIKEADPELERLLAEEEEIERRVHQQGGYTGLWGQTPH
jgi:hypothetical protein